MGYAAYGLTSKETGKVMYLSYETVKVYRKSVIMKLNGRNVTHCVAILMGLNAAR